MRFSILLIGVLFFQTVSAQHAYEFLRLDVSPRAAALGGSYAAGADDADIIFHNPAGIYFLEETPVNFSFVKHLMDINLAGLSASHEVEGIGRFGAAISYITYGTFTEADANGNRLGEYSAGDLAFLIGYANMLGDNLYYGANIKLIHSSLADYSSSAVAFDVGLQYVFGEGDTRLGLAIKHFGTQLSTYTSVDEDLPTDITLGFSQKLARLPLILFLDFHKLNEESDSFFQRFNAFSVGGEFRLSEALKLRVGYDNEKRKELKVGDFAGFAGFNLGLGVRISEYTFDYAFSSWGEVGALHRIGINTSF